MIIECRQLIPSLSPPDAATGEVEACYRELQGLEAFVDFLDGNLLSRDSWTASELHRYGAAIQSTLPSILAYQPLHTCWLWTLLVPCMLVNSAAAELVLNSLGGGAGRHVRLYVMQPDKNLLACVEKDGQVRGREHITPGVQRYLAHSNI